MDFVGATNGPGRGFREAQIADFTLTHKVGHGPDCIFNGNGFINAMLIVKVNYVSAQPFEAGCAGLFYVLRRALDAQKFAVWSAHVAELGGKHHLVTTSFD